MYGCHKLIVLLYIIFVRYFYKIKIILKTNIIKLNTKDQLL